MDNETPYSQPCDTCRDGDHEECQNGTCGCLATHPDDDQVMRGFKRFKRALHPEREQWVRGGWSGWR